MIWPRQGKGGRPAGGWHVIPSGAAIVVMWLLLAPAAARAEVRLGVLYPKVSGAYTQVFQNIITGLSSVAGLEVVAHELQGDAEVNGVRTWLAENQVAGVVALGQTSYQLAQRLKLELPVVVGAALLSPGALPGISLAADPEALFAHLDTLAPPVKRVFVIYNPATSGWLLPRAEAAAQRRGIKLVAHAATDTREAALAYRQVLEQEAQEGEDALWLPLDNVAPDATVLPMVLEAAWRKRLVVFSNNAAHARKGALFALFPDEVGMGQRLGELFLQVKQHANHEVIPLNDLKVAVNVRTASHLGKLYSSGEQRSFALVFPGQ